MCREEIIENATDCYDWLPNLNGRCYGPKIADATFFAGPLSNELSYTPRHSEDSLHRTALRNARRLLNTFSNLEIVFTMSHSKRAKQQTAHDVTQNESILGHFFRVNYKSDDDARLEKHSFFSRERMRIYNKKT